MIPTIGSDKELDLTELKLVAGVLPPTEQYTEEIDLGAMLLEEIEEGVDFSNQQKEDILSLISNKLD